MLLSKTVWELNIFSKECYSIKPDLLTNATAVDDAITYHTKATGTADFTLTGANSMSYKVSVTDMEKVTAAHIQEEESKEPNYDEDQLEEEEGPEISTAARFNVSILECFYYYLNFKVVDVASSNSILELIWLVFLDSRIGRRSCFAPATPILGGPI
jgi:CHRD domain-containing protein